MLFNRELLLEKIKADANMAKCRYVGVDITNRDKVMYLVFLPPASFVDADFIGRFIDTEVARVFDDDAEYEIFDDYFFNQNRMEETELWENWEACGGSYIRLIEDYQEESEE